MTEQMVRDGGAATRRSGGRGRGGPAVSRERRSGGLKLVSEELEQLEKMDNGISLLQRIKNKLLHHLLSSSLDVLRFLNNVDSKPDPLLPQTTGAVNSTWDQWFERPKEAKRCGCFIL
ncbi:hypothetical protein YC2023_011924 [Brassica napus]